MAKDPAFLFYYQDFLVGTDHMTNEQVGMYIKCLCHQANRGSIREQHMKNICLTHDNHMIIIEKFKKGSNGELFNQRLKEEVDKRKNYAESRRNNRKSDHMKNICETYEKHMETENENENINKKAFDFNKVWDQYPSKIGKKSAERHFRSSVKTQKDYERIQKALDNYKKSKRIKGGYVQNGSTWFNQWQDWIDLPESEKVCSRCNGKGKFTSSTGFEIVCDCPAGSFK